MPSVRGSLPLLLRILLRAVPLAALPAIAAQAAPAAGVQGVVIRGVKDEPLANVRARLSLLRLDKTERAGLSDARLAFLVRQVPGEVRRALEPFGHYEPTTAVSFEPRAAGGQRLVITVEPGDPVRVTARELRIDGAGGDDPELQRALRRFPLRDGDPLLHARYEAGKARVQRLLAERGYFDAELATAQVEVTRATRSAVVRLVWSSGPRYALGAARFDGHAFRPGVLERLVPWTPGEPYDQARLLALHGALTELDYFSAIELSPQPVAEPAPQADIDVRVTPAKRTIYTGGVSYGTDTGAGLRAGIERRWVNDRGHKALAQLELSQRRSQLAAQYRIPAFAWAEGWYTGSTVAKEETFADYTLRSVEAAAVRTGRLGDWTLAAGLHLQRERWTADGEPARHSTLFYPQLSAQTKRADDLLIPRAGWSLSGELRAGSDTLLSDVDFAQLRVEGKWIRSFGRQHRLLLRGELGSTAVDRIDALPLSLRFFAGGDRSVRGYGYRELGPRRDPRDAGSTLIGGKHLAVASIEFERMVSRQWGGAVFVDAGNAFNDASAFDPVVGVGVGLRWRSPVGPVRIDLAHGLDNPDDAWRLHFNIGPDL